MKPEYKSIKNDSFGLYDDRGRCRAWFSSDDDMKDNLRKLNYEERCCTISSSTYYYAKNRIKSWYRACKKIDKTSIQDKKDDIYFPGYMYIGYL